MLPCGPRTCFARLSNGQHAPHVGPCLTPQSAMPRMLSAEAVAVAPGTARSDLMLDIPRLLLKTVWDGPHCTCIIDVTGFAGSVLDKDDYAGDTICACCGDTTPWQLSRGYSCPECSLEECCARCRCPYLEGSASASAKKHCYLCTHNHSREDKTHRSILLDAAWHVLERVEP